MECLSHSEKGKNSAERTMSFNEAFNAVRARLPRKYNRKTKLREKLRTIKTLHDWRTFIVSIRGSHSIKNVQEKQDLLEACLDEMIKMNNGVKWWSMLGGFKDLLMFATLRNVAVMDREWFVHLNPSLKISHQFFWRYYPEQRHDQVLSTVEILNEMIRCLNNLLVHKKPVK